MMMPLCGLWAVGQQSSVWGAIDGCCARRMTRHGGARRGRMRACIHACARRSMDLGSLRQDFLAFNTRSKALPLDIAPLT